MLTIQPKELPVDDCARSKYSQGVAAKDFKLSGVKKVLMLGLMPGVEESHDNIQKLLHAIDLSGLPITFSCDLKLCLYLCGKTQGSCKRPCVFCVGAAPWNGDSSLLTIGALKKFFQDYLEDLAKEDGDHAMDFNNCTKDNLLQFLSFPDDTLILDIINIPELHLLMGTVEKLMKHVQSCFGKLPEEKKRGDEFVKMFLKNINITVRQPGRLEGNQAEKVLKNTVELLRLASELPLDIGEKVFAVCQVLDAFNDVKHACFGTKIMGDYKAAIQKFSTLYRGLQNISVPPKVHMIEQHIVQYLDRKKAEGFEQHGLAYWGEQQFESVHHDFKTLWERRKVGEDHDRFVTILFDAFLEYNATHL